MAAWTVFYDYIYDVAATEQALIVKDVCQPGPNYLYILGNESHVSGGTPFADPEYSVYLYDANTNILALVSDSVVSTITAETYGPSGLYSYAINSTGEKISVGTNGTSPVVILKTRVYRGGAYYETTIIVNAATNNIIYESYANNDAEVWEAMLGEAGHYKIAGAQFRVHTFGGITHLFDIGARQFPGWMLFQNSNMGILAGYASSFPVLNGFYKLLNIRDDARYTATINAGGISYYGNTPTVCAGQIAYGKIQLTFECFEGIPAALFAHGNGDDVSFVGGGPVFTHSKRTISTSWTGEYSSTKASTSHRELRSMGNRVFFSVDDAQVGISVADGAFTCANELYWSNTFFKGKYDDNNELFYISLADRISKDAFLDGGIETACEASVSADWDRYRMLLGGDNADPNYLYITDTSFVIALVYTQEGVKQGYLSFASPVGPKFSIDLLEGLKSFEKAFYVGGKIFLFENVYSNTLYWVEYSLPVNAEPTSVTTVDDTIFIGGSINIPTMFSGATYTTSGISVSSLMTNYPRPAMALSFTLPTMAAPGLYHASPYVKLFGVDGEALVSLYESDAFVHGNILPYRAALINNTYLEDISATLPSGFISRSVEFGLNTYLCGQGGDIYVSSDLDTWEHYDSISSIRATHLSYLDELYAATPLAANSLVRTTSLLVPNFTAADSNLPVGAIVLDLEDDLYADR